MRGYVCRRIDACTRIRAKPSSDARAKQGWLIPNPSRYRRVPTWSPADTGGTARVWRATELPVSFIQEHSRVGHTLAASGNISVTLFSSLNGEQLPDVTFSRLTEAASGKECVSSFPLVMIINHLIRREAVRRGLLRRRLAVAAASRTCVCVCVCARARVRACV